MKKRTSKIAKLEKERTSILTDNLECCILCGKPKDHLHEVYYGKNRIMSMKYKCVVPLCFNCHYLVHNNHNVDIKLKTKMQDFFEKEYPNLNFLEIFGKNYK